MFIACTHTDHHRFRIENDFFAILYTHTQTLSDYVVRLLTRSQSRNEIFGNLSPETNCWASMEIAHEPETMRSPKNPDRISMARSAARYVFSGFWPILKHAVINILWAMSSDRVSAPETKIAGEPETRNAQTPTRDHGWFRRFRRFDEMHVNWKKRQRNEPMSAHSSSWIRCDGFGLGAHTLSWPKILIYLLMPLKRVSQLIAANDNFPSFAMHAPAFVWECVHISLAHDCNRIYSRAGLVDKRRNKWVGI